VFGSRPKHNKTNDDFIFCLFWYAQQQNPYNLKTTPCFCFQFSHVVVLLLLANSNNNKNRHFIYDLSMGLGSVISTEPQNTVYSAEQEAIIKAIQVSGAKKDGG
jgi:hypothetical protein